MQELANHCIEMTTLSDPDTAMMQWQFHDSVAALSLVLNWVLADACFCILHSAGSTG